MGQILKPQIVPVEQQAMTLGGGSLTFRLNRDSLIRRLWLKVTMTLSGAIATSTADGIKALFQNILLRGTIDGRAVTFISSVNSADLFELAQFIGSQLPRNTFNFATTGYKEFILPIDFLHKAFPNFLQFCSCIPAFRMSDLTLTLQPATQAQIDGATTPTFAGTFMVTVLQEQYERESLPLNNGALAIPFIQSEIGTEEFISSTDYGTARKEFRLTAGGLYSYLLARAYASGAAKQADTGAAPFNTSDASRIVLYDLNRQVKQEIDYSTLRALNFGQVFDTLVDGNAAFTFADKGTNGLFDTGRIADGEGNLIVAADVATSSGGKIRFVRQRIMDESNLLGVR